MTTLHDARALFQTVALIRDELGALRALERQLGAEDPRTAAMLVQAETELADQAALVWECERLEGGPQ